MMQLWADYLDELKSAPLTSLRHFYGWCDHKRSSAYATCLSLSLAARSTAGRCGRTSGQN
jgi:hypothetical protein